MSEFVILTCTLCKASFFNALMGCITMVTETQTSAKHYNLPKILNLGFVVVKEIVKKCKILL